MARDWFLEAQYKISKYHRKYKERPKVAALKILAWSAKSLFQKLSSSHSVIPDPGKTAILFRLYGGMGDTIININYINEFTKCFGSDYRICVTGKNNILRGLYGLTLDVVDNSCNDYEFGLVIDLVRIPRIRYSASSFIDNKDLRTWILKIREFENNNRKCFTHCPENDGVLNQISKIMGHNRVSQPDILNYFNIQKKDFYKVPIFNDIQETLKKFALDNIDYIIC